MVDDTQAGGQEGAKSPHHGEPPKNFVIEWRTEENGPALGYVVTELVAYFPDAVSGGLHRGAVNAAHPAFGELFAPGVGRKVILQAVALPDGVVGDATFRVEVSGLSSDNRHRD